jgi:hypothetical protein
MKLERCHSERSEPPLAPMPAALGLEAPATAFAAALRHHRQRQAPRAGELENRQDSPSARRMPNRDPACPESKGNGDECSLYVELDELSSASIDSPRQLTQLIARSDDAAREAAGGTAQRAARRRRDSEDRDAGPCIEVTHQRTGTRCVLSRQDGVWVLSLQTHSALSRAELQTIAETLRSQFAERGLGPVDIIL